MDETSDEDEEVDLEGSSEDEDRGEHNDANKNVRVRSAHIQLINTYTNVE